MFNYSSKSFDSASSLESSLFWFFTKIEHLYSSKANLYRFNTLANEFSCAYING